MASHFEALWVLKIEEASVIVGDGSRGDLREQEREGKTYRALDSDHDGQIPSGINGLRRPHTAEIRLSFGGSDSGEEKFARAFLILLLVWVSILVRQFLLHFK